MAFSLILTSLMTFLIVLRKNFLLFDCISDGVRSLLCVKVSLVFGSMVGVDFDIYDNRLEFTV